MMTGVRVVFALCVLVSGVGTAAFAADPAAAAADCPDVVSRGFEAYARAGAEAALQAWVADGPLQSDEFVASQAGGLHRIEAFYGKYQSYDQIRVQAITPRLRAVYLTMYFEKGPAFCYMLCYQTAGGKWVVSDFDGSTSPRRILPEYGAVAAPLLQPTGGGGAQ
jgi:hypothetical protein